jgi:hypothetical protein
VSKNKIKTMLKKIKSKLVLGFCQKNIRKKMAPSLTIPRKYFFKRLNGVMSSRGEFKF